MTSIAIAAELCRMIVAAVLLLAVVGKARNIPAFAEGVAELSGLGDTRARLLAPALVAVEATILSSIAAGGDASRIGLLAAAILLAALTLPVGAALIRRRKVDCNCFGRGAHILSVHDLVRNLLLIAACSVALTAEPSPPLGAAARIELGGLAIILAILALHLREICTGLPE